MIHSIFLNYKFHLERFMINIFKYLIKTKSKPLLSTGKWGFRIRSTLVAAKAPSISPYLFYLRKLLSLVFLAICV